MELERAHTISSEFGFLKDSGHNYQRSRPGSV